MAKWSRRRWLKLQHQLSYSTKRNRTQSELFRRNRLQMHCIILHQRDQFRRSSKLRTHRWCQRVSMRCNIERDRLLWDKCHRCHTHRIRFDQPLDVKLPQRGSWSHLRQWWWRLWLKQRNLSSSDSQFWSSWSCSSLGPVPCSRHYESQGCHQHLLRQPQRCH